MAKLTLHFKNQAEYDAYWNGETPGSKWLCIIESVDVDESGTETVSNVLITSTNNYSGDGKNEEMGNDVVETVQAQSEVIEDNDEEITELQTTIELATSKSEEIKLGEINE